MDSGVRPKLKPHIPVVYNREEIDRVKDSDNLQEIAVNGRAIDSSRLFQVSNLNAAESKIFAEDSKLQLPA